MHFNGYGYGDVDVELVELVEFELLEFGLVELKGPVLSGGGCGFYG